MNRPFPPSRESHLLVEALEPRIAPAGLLNELKFTSVTAGGSVLLDASDPNGFQGITTGFGPYAGSYLLYITAGKALVYTSDLNGNGKVDYNEITGIAAGVDSLGRPLDLISFTNINGDVATNLMPGKGVSALTDSDNNPNNGRDGRILLDNAIHSITFRTLNAGDIDTTVPGNTVANRLALTSFSLFGTVFTGADFGSAGSGLTIDVSGAGQLTTKFDGTTGSQLYTGSVPSIGGIKTGTAANNQYFHFGESSGADIQGTFVNFKPKPGEHGGDITGVKALLPTTAFDIGTLETGAGGTGARGGNLAEIILNGDRGTYQLIAGDGGQGGSGAQGGSIINFNDLGTVNSHVLIHTGAGGVGLLGAGGLAGTATFANAKIASNLVVVLGDGGDGFTAGGNGASQPSAVFAIPEGSVPVGGGVQGTYHDIGDIGNTRYTGTDGAGNALYAARGIDFDGDGFGDVVYTTKSPDQLVILFGDGSGNFDLSKTLYIDAPGTSLSSFVVADFNGDGKPDIALASADSNNFGGVSVFLNQIGDPVHNPLGGKLFAKNVLGNHPFSPALQSALPTLSDAGYLQGRNPVLGLTAGDFNGDGIMDLALADNLTFYNNGLKIERLITVLFGDDVRNPDTGARILDPGTGHPEGSGYFFANTAAAGQAPVLSINAQGLSNGNRVVIRASNLSVNSGAPDAFFYGTKSSRNISEFYVATDPVTHVAFGLIGTLQALSRVDTNRNVGMTAFQNATLQDFSLTDLNSDGVVDLIALTTQPAGFLVGLKGATTNAGDPGAYTLKIATKTDDNGGVFYFDAGVFGTGTEPLAIQPIDLKTDGSQNGDFNQFAIEALTGIPQTAVIKELSLEVIPPPTGLALGADVDPMFYAGGTGVAGLRQANSFSLQADDTVTAFDAYYPILGARGNPAFPLLSQPTSGYTLLDTNTSSADDAYFEVFSPATLPLFTGATQIHYLTFNTVSLYAGNGGNSTAGVAGSGGVVGTGLSTGADGEVAGSIQVIFPAYLSYLGTGEFFGGAGGAGFLGGGLGGDVTGVSTRTVSNLIANPVQLIAGVGGNGISGDGGRGGDISQISIQTNIAFFQAGNAGTGQHGGRGGSVLGNQSSTFYDVQSITVSAVAGNGGVGALGGGMGGSVSNFIGNFISPIGSVGGSLVYTAGNGGAAVSGDGGNGGGITNSSPSPLSNSIANQLILNTGNGGNGLNGGTGGAITNFVNSPTDPSAIPFQMSIITGRGGIGVVGPGGAGGTITNFQSNASGLTAQFGGTADLVRVIAGDGGASYGGVGGAGGGILNVTAQAISSPIAVLTGAGGAGLSVGGTGGSVNNSVINSAAQVLGKVLVVAGAGGDAIGVASSDVVVANDVDTTDLAHAILAIGSVSGIGGNGGNITNLTQPISVQTAVDLIAGNGGSTLNYGSSISATSGVGVGGSVQNVNLAGTVGNSVRNATTGINPPIRSYVDTDGDGADDRSLDQYAQTLGASVTVDPTTALALLAPAAVTPNAGYSALLLGQGNVGIVAGIAGRVTGGAPPRNGTNGSVQTVAASSFMSIIAGSVNNVAPVNVVSGLTIKDIDGVFGADKSLPDLPPFGGPNSQVEYYDLNGRVVSNLAPGYRLIDGAIYAQTILQPATPPNIAGPRVIPFTAT